MRLGICEKRKQVVNNVKRINCLPSGNYMYVANYIKLQHGYFSSH